MNRQQRRILKSGKGKKKLPPAMAQAAQGVEKAVAQLDKVGDLDGTLAELKGVMVETQEGMSLLMADHQALAEELKAQREINIRLLTILLGPAVQRNLSEWSEPDLARVRALEGSLREQYTVPEQDGQ